jgi:uncharacterized membrane protein YfcA
MALALVAPAVGGVITASAGVGLSYRLPDRLLRGLLIGLLTVSTIAMFVTAS